MSELQSHSLSGYTTSPTPPSAAAAPAAERISQGRTFSPRVDIYEGPEDLLVIADLPGVSADQLSVRFEGDTLSIEGKVAKLRDDIEAFSYARSFKVPRGIDAGHISADLKGGVLTLRLPRQSQVQARQINVRVD
jgi:HSP20 family protein